jgi:hypothetical protein
MASQKALPQRAGKLMPTADGFETWMQYVDGFKLRHFCGFELLNDARGLACLKNYHRKVVEAAVANGFGMINEGLHYRASRDWGELVGLSRAALEEINIRGIEFYRDFAREYASPDAPMLVSGAIGPRGDAYNIGRLPDAAEAECNPLVFQDHLEVEGYRDFAIKYCRGARSPRDSCVLTSL